MNSWLNQDLDIGYGQDSLGFNDAGFSTSSPDFLQMMGNMREDWINKALTTGSGIITDGGTGGGALREQWLHGLLESVSFTSDDAVGIKRIPKGKAWSTILEWTTQDQYGQGGDGFTPENGSDGLFGNDFQDDNYTRQTENVKFMIEGRQVGIVANRVRNIADPNATSKQAAMRAMLGKMDLALYFGDASTDVRQYNGLKRQIMSWATRYPADQGIIFDAGGQPLDKAMLEDIAILNRNYYGKGSLLLLGTLAYGDSQKLLFPEARFTEGGGGTMGNDFRNFKGPRGRIELDDDPMLRPNQPLRPDGPGSDGLARTSATADTGSLAWAANPFVAPAGALGAQATAAGTGPFWVNANTNVDTAILGTLPGLPTGLGNNVNRLAAATYYYGASIVYKGKEGPIYIYGAGAQTGVAITGTPTGLTATANQVIQLDFDTTTPQITGLGTTYPRNQIKLRIYRYGGPGLAAPVNVADFAFLQEVGIPTAGNARVVDNGTYMAGKDNAFLITTEKDGRRGWEMLQLLPPLWRLLPNLALADQFCLISFLTPILWVRRHHVWVRNIGRV